MEENYSRGKRFGDKFWNGKTIDVLSVGFLFLRFPSVSEARLVCEAWVSHEKEISKVDRLGLIQGLGISLGSFYYLIQWLTSSKTYYIRRLWSIVDLETKSQTHSSLLYLAVSFLSSSSITKILFLHHFHSLRACWIIGLARNLLHLR